MNWLYKILMRQVRTDRHIARVGGLTVKKIVVFLMMLGLGIASRGAVAQDLFESQTLGELPPMMMPDPTDATSSHGTSVVLPEEFGSSAPIQEPLSLPATTGGDPSPSWGYFTGQDLQMFDCQPALLESTGTWLRRGFWSAEIEAVLLNRHFDRNSIVLMDDLNANLNVLRIQGNAPGVEGTPRLTVGRFLFRDQANRDHTAEFVAWGGGNWSQEGRLDGEDLQVPIRRDGFNTSFDGAQASQYEYGSSFNSFELNYHVKQRMLKDRMELEPNGQWVRRAQPSHSYSMLAGLRYFNLEERLNWDAFGIPDGDSDSTLETGNYDINVGNNLIGTQLGASTAYETARWSVGANVKAGMYLNMIDLQSDFNISGGGPSGTTDLEGDNLSFIGEAGLMGKYHILPNLSLKVGLEVMLLTHMAAAPGQINFIPSGANFIASGNDNYYLGGSIGLENYW